MSVHQLKDGRWVVRYPDPDGKDINARKCEYFGRGAIAEQKARLRNESLDLQKKGPVKNEDSVGPTLSELATEYLINKNFRNDSSRDLCQLRLSANILPALGDIQAIRLTYDNMEKYVRLRRRSVKASTARREITDIKAILNWASKRRPPLIPMNPIRDFVAPLPDDAVIIPPTKEEVKAILKHANERLKRAITLSWYTGLRPGAVELFALKWDSVLWEKNVIRVVSAEKGGPGIRHVPIHPLLIETLRKWYEADNNPLGPIIHDKGKSIASLKKAWKIAKEKAGITRRLRLYDLRHYFVTTAIESGTDYKTLSEIVGSSPETLRKYYQHVSNAAMVSAIENMPDIN